MPRRKTKLICGTCGSTGSVLVGDVDGVCTDCKGVGYTEVVHEDARTMDQIRERQHLVALNRFTGFVALLVGVGITYTWFREMDYLWLALAFIGTSLFSYFFLSLRGVAEVMYMIMIFLKVVVGFVVIAGLLIGVTYLFFRARQIGGW